MNFATEQCLCKYNAHHYSNSPKNPNYCHNVLLFYMSKKIYFAGLDGTDGEEGFPGLEGEPGEPGTYSTINNETDKECHKCPAEPGLKGPTGPPGMPVNILLKINFFFIYPRHMFLG